MVGFKGSTQEKSPSSTFRFGYGAKCDRGALALGAGRAVRNSHVVSHRPWGVSLWFPSRAASCATRSDEPPTACYNFTEFPQPQNGACNGNAAQPVAHR